MVSLRWERQYLELFADRISRPQSLSTLRASNSLAGSVASRLERGCVPSFLRPFRSSSCEADTVMTTQVEYILTQNSAGRVQALKVVGENGGSRVLLLCEMERRTR